MRRQGGGEVDYQVCLELFKFSSVEESNRVCDTYRCIFCQIPDSFDYALHRKKSFSVSVSRYPNTEHLGLNGKLHLALVHKSEMSKKKHCPNMKEAQAQSTVIKIQKKHRIHKPISYKGGDIQIVLY